MKRSRATTAATAKLTMSRDHPAEHGDHGGESDRQLVLRQGVGQDESRERTGHKARRHR